MPTAGWLADTFGRKRTYMNGLVIFTVASILASLSWNPASLIAFRILQAIGGGFLSATSMAVIVEYFPTNALGRALGVWGLGMVLAPALGPYVGGYLIDLVDWRLIFLMGVPFGVAGLILSYALLPDDTDRRYRSFDFAGFALLTASLVLFLYALSEGNTLGWIRGDRLFLQRRRVLRGVRSMGAANRQSADGAAIVSRQVAVAVALFVPAYLLYGHRMIPVVKTCSNYTPLVRSGARAAGRDGARDAHPGHSPTAWALARSS